MRMPERENPSVLLIEGNPSDAALIETICRREWGKRFQLSSVGRLDEAIVVLGHTRPDLILLDLHLPDATPETSLHLLGIIAGRIPTIVITGSDSKEHLERVIAEGVFEDFVQKSQNHFPSTLVKRVRLALEKGRLCVTNGRSNKGRPKTEPLRLLHIEDTESDHILVRMALKRDLAQPFELSWANRVTAGTDSMAANPFDVILLDLHLPDGEGLEIVDRVCRAAQGTPVIAVTGNYEDALALESIKAGTQDYITKEEVGLPGVLARAIRFAVTRQNLFETTRIQAADLQRRNEELRRLTEELTESNRKLVSLSRLKSEFLANMSHELRTPLNAIVGFSALLKDGVTGPLTDRQTDYATEIFTGGHHLLALINDILDLAKVEARKLEVTTSQVELLPLLKNALSVVEVAAKEGELRLDFEFDGSPASICTDERKLKQILYNLLSNAVKFTPAGGRVSLRVSQADQHILFTVKDTGRGISIPDQKVIFAPFQQVDSSISREKPGTGLGLALSDRLAKLLGGEITLQSEYGHGSTFTLILPLALTLPDRESE